MDQGNRCDINQAHKLYCACLMLHIFFIYFSAFTNMLKSNHTQCWIEDHPALYNKK